MPKEPLIVGITQQREDGMSIPPETYPITIFAPSRSQAKDAIAPLTDSGITVAFQRSRRIRAEWVWYEQNPDVETVKIVYPQDEIGDLIKTVGEIHKAIVRNRRRS